ncbi:MAG: hypothetical protein GY698_21365 [Actinomycetia bacterium]|nr:hypothetical protein [Actinomycetes bacterium]
MYADLDLVERSSLAGALGLARGTDQQQLIVAAWRRWGSATPVHLNGQFSFAVWQGGMLTLVRDHFGLTPLVYGQTPEGFVVGGDVRVALQADGISTDIDTDVLATVFLTGHPHHWNTLGATCFGDLKALKPAHRVEVGPHATTESRYWDPRDVTVRRDKDPAALVESFRDLLIDAVAQVTPADGGLVAHLSGGLDSSGIAAIATRVRREAGAADPLTLSWSPGPEHSRTKEHDRAESVADQYGLELEYAPVTVEDRIEQFYRDRTRDPGGMVASEAAPMRIAAQRGASVVLSGWGGDELASFSGRGLIVGELARTGRWAPLAAMALREQRGWRTLASGLIHKPHRGFTESAKRTLEQKRQHALTNGSWLKRDVLAEATLPDEPTGTKQAHEYMAMLLNLGHLGIRGVDWGREAAPHGIRYRYPLLDKRVVEFSLGVPTQMLLNREGRRRWILASALEGIVPDAVRFGVKQEEALNELRQRTGREARERAGADLAERVAGGRQAQYFDIPKVQEQLRSPYDNESGGGAVAASWIGVRR